MHEFIALMLLNLPARPPDVFEFGVYFPYIFFQLQSLLAVSFQFVISLAYNIPWSNHYTAKNTVIPWLSQLVKVKNHTERFLTCAEKDRISNLPQHLIGSILERLPIEDAVRTSVLSKRWRYNWTTMKVLLFDKQFYEEFAENGAFGRNGFIRTINDVLSLHNGPVSKFSLHIPRTDLDSFREVDQTMLLISRKSLIELVLTNSNRCYELPSYVSSCSELRNLELENCIFNPLVKLEVFSNLDRLCLKNIDFGADSCGTLVTLPHLRRLLLVKCKNVYNFNIKASKLDSLTVFSCPDAMLLRLLDTPCLIFLSAEKIPKWLPDAVNNLTYLRLVNFQLGDLDHLHGALCLLRNSPNLERLCMKQLLREPQVMDYDVGPALNHLESPNCLDQTLNQLQTVEIESFEGSRVELLFIKLILAQSPSLEMLTIELSDTFDAHKRLNFAMDVMRFPRASTKAELILLNLEP
ncbi:hypothetical protein OSB04_013170 [Centaurea solstitialis]|uniref:F-box domain-containing protein n=1 Tax=Centaurea solstitialis TaxID=347529 RepID=A0AA38TQN7_9ASTR|nr:hypothetical protein OSB04_013170 [Centaurea solstitialis]